MFGLVDKGIGNKDMVCSTAALGKSPLEGVGDVGVCHEVHKASVKNTSEELSKAASDGDGAVVSWVMLEPFLWRAVI